jgi:hypothetical protein
MSLPDDLTRTPVMRVSVVLPGDAAAEIVDLVALGPATSSCRSIRWMGAGAATVYYQPATPRTAFTASETAAGVPVMVGERQFLPLPFLSQGEEQDVQAVALLNTDGAGHTSTAGTYVVTF